MRRGVRVKAFGRFTPDRAFAIRVELEGPLSIVKILLQRGFPYTLLFEHTQEGGWRLTLKEEIEGSTMWSTGDSGEVKEILGCIVERGGFEEEFYIDSESKSYILRGFRRLLEGDKRNFKEALNTI